MRKAPFLSLLLGVLVLLGTGGCGNPQPTHHSGQIGRFYGEGVSFSVPMLSRAAKPGAEDRYWELRRGIDKSVVVAFKPLSAADGSVRENMALTVQELERAMAPAEFRLAQARELGTAGQVSGSLQEGQDGAGPWLGFTREVQGRKVVCRAWFFTEPAQGQRRPRGFVLLGTAPEGPSVDQELVQFGKIAATFRFGRPPTGFALLGQAVDRLSAALAASTPQAVPLAPPVPGTAPAPSAQPEALPQAPGAPVPAPPPAAPVPTEAPAAPQAPAAPVPVQPSGSPAP